MPHLKIKTATAKQDAWLFEQFAKMKTADFDALQVISRHYPNLSEALRENNSKEVLHFVQNWHEKHREVLQENRAAFEKGWKHIENDFFLALENLFRVKIKKIITAELSMVPIYPRDLYRQRFNIPYKDTNFQIAVAMHEIVHFYYFALWAKIFPEHSDDTYEAPHLVWYLSEIMAPIILNNTPELKKSHKVRHKTYPEFEQKKIGTQSINAHFGRLYRRQLKNGEDMENILRRMWQEAQEYKNNIL